TNNRPMIGRTDTLKSGSEEVSRQAWSIMPHTQTSLGMNLYPSSHSWMTTTLDMGYVQSTECTPSIINGEEESWLETAWRNYNQYGGETTMGTTTQYGAETEVGNSRAGLWDWSSSPSSVPIL